MGFSSSKKNKKVNINKENLCPILTEFLCCKCGEIPEALKVHLDNSKIELNCRKCGIYEILIDDYYNEISKKNYFKKCSNCEKEGLNNEYFYCLTCNNIYCESCKNKKHSDHTFIEEKEKKRICIRHNKEFKYFCFDCQENFCEEEKEVEHKEHEITHFSDFKKSMNDIKNEIMKINKELNNLVDLNETILKYSENLKYKECYLNSIINMGKSIKEGNERNSKDTRCLLNGLSKDIDNSLKSIDSLIDHKQILLKRNEKYLYLNNKELDDLDFKYISQIRFNQLKEIDISENNITNVEPFKKMSLPFLEFLNLSYNKINKIEPVTKLKSYKLQYIFLQRNNIEDIETFLESYFPSLKILRVEDNNINEEKEKIKESLNKIYNLYCDRFIYKPIEEQIKEFKDKYEIEISGDSEDIDLCDRKGGNKMLKNLFLIITYKPKNKIKKLNLRNNDIKDPSILNLINFNKLEVLDLAVNYIDNLEFLSNMKSKNLKYLYLDNNNYNDISPILNANLPKLEVLSLNEDNLDEDIMREIHEMKINNPYYEKKITIQLEKSIKDQPLSKREKPLIEERLIPKVDFLCPECGKFSPEISNINIDNMCIEFKCKKCGIKEYNSKYLNKEIDKNNNIIIYYGEKYFHERRVWFKEYLNQKMKLALNKSSFKFQNNELDFNKYKEIIKEKNEQLKKIIKFNDIIIDSSEKYQNNYFLLKSLKNIYNSYQRENNRDSNDLKFIFTDFNNKIKYSNKAINEIFDKKDIKIKREEESLFLSNKKLNDEYIKCISLIKFNQLKEIDLSENEITNIESFCNINLPFLEFLNLSYNKIKNIEPLSEINPRKLKYLFIQNNQIEDIQIFLDDDFPKLEILRVENNKINENLDSFIKLLELYYKSNKILVTNKTIDEFKKKYDIEYNEEKVEVEGAEEGNSLLKNIFIIISQKNKNKIRNLKLRRNNIEDPSILNRIHFEFLKELDISSNNIKNLKFLKGMKSKNLKRLYLNNNYINDLSLLYNIEEYFPYLEYIALNNNNFNPDDSKYRDLLNTLKEHRIEIIIKSN